MEQEDTSSSVCQNGAFWSDRQSSTSEDSSVSGSHSELDRFHTDGGVGFSSEILSRAFQRVFPELTANIIATDYLDHLVSNEVISLQVMNTISSKSGTTEMARALLYQIVSRDGGCETMMKLFQHRDINQRHLYDKVLKEYKFLMENKQTPALPLTPKESDRDHGYGKYAEFLIEVIQITNKGEKSVSTNALQIVKSLLASNVLLENRLLTELQCTLAEDVPQNDNYLRLIALKLSPLTNSTAGDEFEWMELTNLINNALGCRLPDASIHCYIRSINISSFISLNHQKGIVEKLGEDIHWVDSEGAGAYQDQCSHATSTSTMPGIRGIPKGIADSPILLEPVKALSQLSAPRRQSGSEELIVFSDFLERKTDQPGRTNVSADTADARYTQYCFPSGAAKPVAEDLQSSTAVSCSSTFKSRPASYPHGDDLLDFLSLESKSFDCSFSNLTGIGTKVHGSNALYNTKPKLKKASTVEGLSTTKSSDKESGASPKAFLAGKPNSARAPESSKSKTMGPSANHRAEEEEVSQIEVPQETQNSRKSNALQTPQSPKSPNQNKTTVPQGLLEMLRKVPIGVGKGRGKSNEVMNDVIKKILENLQTEHRDLVLRPEYAGSSFEGAKIESADEFDVLIILDGKELDRTQLHPLYVTLCPRNRDNAKFKEYLSADGYLDPAKVRSKVISWVTLAINKYFPVSHECKVELSQNGPAVTLSIEPNPKSKPLVEFIKIDVDLVPAFQVLNDYYVTKPCKVNLLKPGPGVPKKEVLWRKSFSLHEKQRLQGIDKGGGCRRQCLRILKFLRIREATLKGLDSYHYKVLLLNECQELPDTKDIWSKDQLAERFWGLLQSLVSYLEQGKLSHCIENDINLFEEINPKTLENIRTRLNKIMNKGVVELEKIFDKQPIS